MISLATEDDIPELIPLVNEFCSEVFPDVIQDDMKIIETLATMLVKGVIVLLKNDNKIVGLLGGLKTELAFSRETMAAEVVWYVQPEHRGQSLRMHDAFEYWANLSDCNTAVMGSIGDHRISSVYKRRGYHLHEQAYVKRLK